MPRNTTDQYISQYVPGYNGSPGTYIRVPNPDYVPPTYTADPVVLGTNASGDRTYNGQTADQLPPASLDPGTNVRDHTTGLNYTAGGPDDPNALVPRDPTQGGDVPLAGTDSRDKATTDLANTTADRTPPTIAPPPQVTPSTVTPVTLGPLQQALVTQAQGVTLGNAPTVAGVTVGGGSSARGGVATGAAATADQIGALQQAQESTVRPDLLAALAYQGSLMRGENSVAALVANQRREEALAQTLSMARSGRPGQGAMAARVAAQTRGSLLQKLAQDEQAARLAERNAAAGAYGQLGLGISGQDVNLSQFNAGQFNQGAMKQAELGTGANIATAGNLTNANIATANNATSASVANAQASTQRAIAQGQISSQQALTNAQLAADRSALAAKLEQEANLANAGYANTASMFNAGQGNEQTNLQGQMAQQANITNAGNTQQADIFNAGTTAQISTATAQLAQQAIEHNDQTTIAALNANLANAVANQNGKLTQEQLQVTVALGKAGMLNARVLAQMGIDAQQAMQPGFWDKVLAGTITLGAATISAASDARLKMDIQPITGALDLLEGI